MATLVPTILTSDPAVYQRQATLYSQFAQRIQIDIMDGTFTSTTTLPDTALVFPPNIEIDLHMMVLRPSEHYQTIVKLKPSLVIFHAEAQENLLAIFAELKKLSIKTGIALLKTTFPGAITPYIQTVDHVMLFAGALGKQGGTADLLQIEKVKLIRAINPKVEIGWDGGANIKNIRALAHADIDVINVGSALSSAQDPAAAYKMLKEESDQRGVRIG